MFLILSKRGHDFPKFLPWMNGCDPRGPWPNVAIGASVENQFQTIRLEWLGATKAAMRFVSMEPLLEAVSLEGYLGWKMIDCSRSPPMESKMLDWVIVGGESGPDARPCEVEWIEHVVRECGEASVPCFVKQLGAKALRVRQFPSWPIAPTITRGIDQAVSTER